MAGPEPGRWLSLAVLLTVMAGVFPRWTVIPHWYVAFSLNISASVVDGGDQIAAVLTLLLIPVGLCDGRKTHWGGPVPAGESTGEGALLGGFVGWIALSVIRFQAAAVYFHAGVAKFGVAEWADGTAMYYWLADPVMGAPAWQRFLVDPVTHSGTGVSLRRGGQVECGRTDGQRGFLACELRLRTRRSTAWESRLFSPHTLPSSSIIRSGFAC